MMFKRNDHPVRIISSSEKVDREKRSEVTLKFDICLPVFWLGLALK
jgi:hypothetical protein